MDKEKQTRSATIEKVEAANQWGYFTIVADEKKYATKSQELAKVAHSLRGKTVEITFTINEKEKDGKTFKNYYVEGVKEASPFDPAPAAAAPAGSKDDSIIRQTVIKAVGAAAAGGNWPIQTAIEWADALYAWVTNPGTVGAPAGTPAWAGPLDEADDLPF